MQRKSQNAGKKSRFKQTRFRLISRPFEIYKLGHFTGQNRLECPSYLIQDIKMYPCVKFGAFITI